MYKYTGYAPKLGKWIKKILVSEYYRLNLWKKWLKMHHTFHILPCCVGRSGWSWWCCFTVCVSVINIVSIFCFYFHEYSRYIWFLTHDCFCRLVWRRTCLGTTQYHCREQSPEILLLHLPRNPWYMPLLLETQNIIIKIVLWSEKMELLPQDLIIWIFWR